MNAAYRTLGRNFIFISIELRANTATSMAAPTRATCPSSVVDTPMWPKLNIPRSTLSASSQSLARKNTQLKLINMKVINQATQCGRTMPVFFHSR
ncbi:hypothetical protein D1872_241110 [compost metagenome]